MSFNELMAHAEHIQYRATQEHIVEGSDGQIKREDATPSSGLWASHERQFTYIPDLFEPFTRNPNPASFDPMIRQLAAAKKVLRTDSGEIDTLLHDQVGLANPMIDRVENTVGGTLEGWTGRGAQAFKAEFTDVFPTVVTNQYAIVSILKAALEAEREIWVRVRHDIDDIAHQTVNALDHVADCGQQQWALAFTIMGAVVAVAASAATGGVLVGLTVVASGASVSAALAPGDGKDPGNYIEGDTVHAVLHSMAGRIRSLNNWVDHHEERIARALNEAATLITTGDNRRRYFEPVRPLLATADIGTIRDRMGRHE